MSTPKTIVIDGTEYVRKTDIPAGPPTDKLIVVADRGWVFIGDAVKEGDNSLTLTNAKVIRRWGTDAARPGLGWLAANGPTENTKLEDSGTVRVPSRSVVSTFDVTYSGGWS